MTASTLKLGSEFNKFLFAPLWEDDNGLNLSVVSAFARLDMDPWQEASELARLSAEKATDRMVFLIGALQNRPKSHVDSLAVAGRVVALLPDPSGRNLSSNHSVAIDKIGNVNFIMIAVFALYILGSLLVATGRSEQGKDDSPHTAVSNGAALQTESPGSRQ